MAGIMEDLRRPLSAFSDPLFSCASRTDYQRDETGLPKSDVLSFRLSGDLSFVVRPSGTEPKFRITTESKDQKKAESYAKSFKKEFESIYKKLKQ